MAVPNHPATVLHAYDGELVDVIPMDGSDRIERVEETMLRRSTRRKQSCPLRQSRTKVSFERAI